MGFSHCHLTGVWRSGCLHCRFHFFAKPNCRLLHHMSSLATESRKAAVSCAKAPLGQEKGQGQQVRGNLKGKRSMLTHFPARELHERSHLWLTRSLGRGWSAWVGQSAYLVGSTKGVRVVLLSAAAYIAFFSLCRPILATPPNTRPLRKTCHLLPSLFLHLPPSLFSACDECYTLPQHSSHLSPQ